MSTTENFEGHEHRECGEHRTTGARAWCFECNEWCSPNTPCKGCEMPMIRKKVEELEAELQEIRDREASDAISYPFEM